MPIERTMYDQCDFFIHSCIQHLRLLSEILMLDVRRPIQKSRYHMIPFILSREQTQLSLYETKVITAVPSLGYSKGPLCRAKVTFLWVIMFCILIGTWVTSTILILSKQPHASIGPCYGVPLKKIL